MEINVVLKMIKLFIFSWQHCTSFFFFLQDVHALHFNPPAPTGF